ncbi:hypothetical protein [Parvularcula sp. IMCC14364]|uniref:hypothetical protein n=1 Tax=Parvularcula sp. IMCC14364 TaxID=3067902 RepID=UPI0027413F9D|nr:hypothetical protein [Parvularcula sp. IMCC14364]
MLNFFKSVLLAAIATIPVFAVTLPIQAMLTMMVVDLQHERSLSIDFTDLMSVGEFLGIAALGGIAAVYALVVGSIGAIIVDKFFIPNGGSKKQYARTFAIVGFIGSGLFAFIFAVPALIAGYVAGWVYGANRKLNN